MEANTDMVQGYLDGRNIDNPEPSANRSRSYRHGFKVGRNEKLSGPPLADFQTVLSWADAAMAADAVN